MFNKIEKILLQAIVAGVICFGIFIITFQLINFFK
jgi:hypothetical protein